MAADRTSSGFGGMLREARERRGVSLREIANATKISVGALESLERNDISKLPGGIFSRAFVRAYAAEVGLDPEATIQDFIGAFPHDSVTVGHPTSAQVDDEDATESHRRVAGTIVRLIAVSLPMAALVLYLGTAGRRAAPLNESSPVAPEPPLAAAQPPAALDTSTAPPAEAAAS